MGPRRRGAAPRRSRGGAAGPADLGRARLAGADLVRPGRDLGDHHAVHGALRTARRAGKADAGKAAGAEPRRILVGVGGRPQLRVRAAPGRHVPQRRSGHRRGRQVLVRALSRRLARHDEGAGGGGRDARSAPRALQAQGAVARFPDVLRQRHRRRLDRAEEIRREGRRRGLQEGAGRRRPLQIRLVHAGRRAGAGGIRAATGARSPASSASC